MESAYWIVAGLLALAYLAAGAQKATCSRAQLALLQIGAAITHLIRREPKVLPMNVALLALAAAAAAVLGSDVRG